MLFAQASSQKSWKVRMTTALAKTTASTPVPAVNMAQQSRQHAARSQAYTLLTNGEPNDEIADAIAADPQLPAVLDDALRGTRNELSSAVLRDGGGRPDHRALLRVELGKYLRFAGGGWPAEQRQEWIEGVEEELRDYPFDIVLESIRRGRRKVKAPWSFVEWVCADVEPIVERLKAEERRLAELREIARA